MTDDELDELDALVGRRLRLMATERKVLHGLLTAAQSLLDAQAECAHPRNRRVPLARHASIWCGACGALGTYERASNEIRWLAPALALPSGG